MKFIRPICRRCFSQSRSWGSHLHLSVPIGIILLICTALYARTRHLRVGAVLAHGISWWRGLVTDCAIGDPLFFNTLFPVYFAIFLWAGVCLREPRLPACMPVRK